jgi:hypothetical protein
VRDFVLRAEGHYNSPSREPVSELRFALGEASPNPFNPSTQISYSLAEDGMVRLNIHDARGALVRTLVHEYQSSGTRSVVWNGRDDRGHAVSSGVYFYVLESGAKKASHKMLLVK